MSTSWPRSNGYSLPGSERGADLEDAFQSGDEHSLARLSDIGEIDGRRPHIDPNLRKAWRGIYQRMLEAINSHPGENLGDTSSVEILADLKGYSQALRPMGRLICLGKLHPADPKVWQVYYQLKGAKFRPRFVEVEGIIEKILGIEKVSGGDAAARTVVAAPRSEQAGLLGIPAATVSAAYRDVDLPKGHDITPADIPDLDRYGKRIEPGRKAFLAAYHRMRGDLDPDWDRARRRAEEAEEKRQERMAEIERLRAEKGRAEEEDES
jgi:hypothetical protein